MLIYIFFLLVEFNCISVYIYVYSDNIIYIVYVLVTIGDWGQSDLRFLELAQFPLLQSAVIRIELLKHEVWSWLDLPARHSNRGVRS